ncbi:carboxymuconolactone decarboxylase family protein [Mycolicibacterium hodleri]|uniref:Carboxymuconolactone decarboxylase family protein n=1 Tax=Mycolicibacterium hodleri TaxID=49897 RepID=A0A502EFX0_9MYCO|nr:carboxymuconolactone decarboxylase family protein [Mycolicibacterium hodleri]
MTDVREKGLEVFRELLPDAFPDVEADLQNGEFGGELAELTLDNVFGGLWTREGLDRRSRSLVTLGVLVALRATSELEVHFPIALRNGLTEDEIAEVIYHCSGYAGFPAASTALAIAKEALGKLVRPAVTRHVHKPEVDQRCSASLVGAEVVTGSSLRHRL